MLFNEIKLGNRFAFPGDLKPGFDPNHPASRGCRLSIVPQMNYPAMRHLYYPIPCTFTAVGTILFAKSQIGPVCDAHASNSYLNSTGFPSVATSSYSGQTQAVIIIPAGIYAGSNQVITRTAAAFTGIELFYGVPYLCSGAGSVFGSSATLVANVPYFIACSYNGSTVCNIVVTNLNTGAIIKNSGYTTNRGFQATTLFTLGYTGSYASQSYYAAAMYAESFMNMPELYQWATDPWSFWYQDTPIIT